MSLQLGPRRVVAPDGVECGLDLGQDLLALAAVVAVVLVLIPILFFGLELIILGVLLAAGIIARTLARARVRV